MNRVADYRQMLKRNKFDSRHSEILGNQTSIGINDCLRVLPFSRFKVKVFSDNDVNRNPAIWAHFREN